MRWRGGPISGLLRSKSPGIFGRQAKLVQTHRSQGLRRHPMRSIANVLRVKPMNRREGVALTAERAADRSAHRARSVPSELRAFAEPYLLPGESYRDFAIIQKMMIDEVRPESRMEWLWTLDLVEPSWEISIQSQSKKPYSSFAQWLPSFTGPHQNTQV